MNNIDKEKALSDPEYLKKHVLAMVDDLTDRTQKVFAAAMPCRESNGAMLIMSVCMLKLVQIKTSCLIKYFNETITRLPKGSIGLTLTHIEKLSAAEQTLGDLYADFEKISSAYGTLIGNDKFDNLNEIVLNKCLKRMAGLCESEEDELLSNSQMVHETMVGRNAAAAS